MRKSLPYIAGLSLILIVLNACAPQKPVLQTIRDAGVLHVLTRNAATTYYTGPHGAEGLEYKLVKAVILALLTCMIGFGIMVLTKIVPSLSPKPLTVFGSITGGVIFGMGMVLAGGCASGTTYRVGEGMVGSLIALLGFCIGLIVAKFGLLAPVTVALQIGPTPILLFGALTPIFMVIIGSVGFAVVAYLWILPAIKEKKEKKTDEVFDLKTKIFKKGWPWYTTGILVGLVNIIAWPVAFYVAGKNYPLGISGGWLSNAQGVLTGSALLPYMWFGLIVIGIIVGAFVGAILAGEFKIRAPKDGKILLQQLIGGIVMGIGAIIAMGCNIGNLLSGIPQFSLAGIVVGLGIVLGCWIMTYLMFMRKD